MENAPNERRPKEKRPKEMGPNANRPKERIEQDRSSQKTRMRRGAQQAAIILRTLQGSSEGYR